MRSKSTRPYLVRAIWEWCTDNGYTPYLSVLVDAETRVPAEYVKNGEIVLNVSPDATHKLTIGNESIQFAARFGGVSRECSIPIQAVKGIFARENGEGLFFQPEQPDASNAQDGAGPPMLQSVKPDGGGETTGQGPGGDNGGNGGSGGKRPRLQVVK